MNNSFEHRLSPGATARLDEISSELTAKILWEADRLNPTDTLTARDISDGFHAVQLASRDEEGSAYRLSQRLRWSRVLVIYAATAGVAALIAGALALVSSFRDFRLPYVEVTVAAFALTAGTLMVSIVLLALRESRVSRMRALQYAEESREMQRSEYALEAARQALHESLNDTGDALLPRFIAQWARLEDRLRRLAQVALGMPSEISTDYPIGGLLRDLIRVGVLDSKRGEDLQDVLDVRNQVAHGRSVSSSDLSMAVRLMERLELFLDDYITDHTLT